MDGIAAGIGMDQAAGVLQARIQSGQVISNRVPALDVGTILIHMDFVVESTAGN